MASIKDPVSKVVIGTKLCRKCGALIQFRNHVSFDFSIRKGGTLCRKCSGKMRGNQAPVQEIPPSITPLPNFWRVVESQLSGSTLR